MMAARNSLYDFFEDVTAPDEENTRKTTKFDDGKQEIAYTDPSPRLLDTQTLSNDSLIEEYVVVKILNIDTEKSVLSNNPKTGGANIRHTGGTNESTVINVNHLTDISSEDGKSRSTRFWHDKLFTDEGRRDYQRSSTDKDKALIIKPNIKDQNTEMSVSNIDNSVENVPSVNCSPDTPPDTLDEMLGREKTCDHATEEAGSTGDVVRVEDVINTDTNIHPVSGTTVGLGDNGMEYVPNAGKYADPSVDAHINGNTDQDQFTGSTHEGTNSQSDVNNYTNLDVGGVEMDFLDPNNGDATDRHISVCPEDHGREDRVIDISATDEVGDAVRENALYDDTLTETEVDKTVGFGKIDGVSKDITHAETDIDADSDKRTYINTCNDGHDDEILEDCNVEPEIDTCISVGKYDIKRKDLTDEYDVGDVDENNNDDNENTTLDIDDKPNDDNGDVSPSTEQRDVDDDNPFLASKDITAKCVNVNGANAPLSNRKTKCDDVRLRLSDDGHRKRPGGGRVKPGTSYPLHGLVRAVDVPSGALGDSIEPALNDPDTNQVLDNASRTNQYSAELGPTPVIPGKLSETPRFSSVLREIEMRPNSGTATAISDSSGRKNPQAKVDGEVRPLAGVAHVELFRRTLVAVKPDPRRSLPPIQTTKKLVSGATEKSTTKDTKNQRTKLFKTIIDHSIKSQVVRETKKPAVPKLLKSTVCYHEGNVDVSIFSDQGLMIRSDPVHLNINFLRRPLAQTNLTKSAQPNRDNRTGLSQETRPVLSGIKSTKVPANQQHKRTSQPRRQRTDGKPNKYLAPIQNAPKIKTCTSNDSKQFKRDGDKTTSCSNKPSKTKRNIRRQSNVNLWSRRLEPLDWNIVNRRAQKPPFNTHTNPDASHRHMQFFMDY